MKRFVWRGWLCLGIITLLSIFSSPPPVSAATQVASTSGIMVAPFLQSLSLASFEPTKTFTVQVTNRTSTARSFKATVADFGPANEFGGIAFLGLTSQQYDKQHALSPWLTLDHQAFTLKPNQSITITGTVRNTNDLAPGGHYGAVLVNEVGPTQSRPNTIAANAAVSSLVFVTKLGGEHYDLHLSRLQPATSWWHLPRTASVRFENPGNVQVVPRGTVNLTDQHDNLLGRGIINDDSGYILPGSYRQFSISLNRIQAASWWPHRYKLQIDYRYDGYTQIAHRSQTFYYVALPHMLLLILGLLVIMRLGYLLYQKRLWKSLQKPYKKA